MFQKTKGVIAAGNKYTAESGKRVMESGGNVFDAVVAACFTSFVTEPTLTSAGGSGFLLAQKHNQKPVLYDFFSQTPLQKRPVEQLDFYPINFDFSGAIQEFHIGLASMSVPGNIKGLFQLHQQMGIMPFKEVLQPAIHYAKNGFQFSAFSEKVAKMVVPVWENLPKDDFFFKVDGKLLKEGDTAYAPKIAASFDFFANNGIREFYEGEIAQKIVKDNQEKGGYLTMQDFQNYEVISREPTKFTYQGKTIYTNPPPSLGGSLIELTLNLIDKQETSKSHLNALTKAMRLVNAKRKTGLDREIRAKGLFEAVDALNMLGNTTHISVIDKAGNAVSTTTTHGEGCGYCAPDTGIIINNILGEADLIPEGFHNWTCNQRVSSMMSPTLVVGKNGVEAALGSGGSNRIRTAIMQVIQNMFKYQMNVKDAVERPRMHLEFDKLEMEPGFEENAVAEIELLAEETLNIWQEKAMFFGGVHCATRTDKGVLDGRGDPRREGTVLMSS